MNAPRHAESAQHDGPTGGRRETPDERSDRNWNDILQELRVSLTGTQLIGGFLLAVAFQPRFVELD
ncbi:MAG: sodium:proton antiporter, partial [Agromyces sp.]|nr:sodium:proton antiporter [Agromyces sp.]